jgi:hypothetical protein
MAVDYWNLGVLKKAGVRRKAAQRVIVWEPLQKVQAGFGTLTTPSLLSDPPMKTTCSRIPGEVS